MLVRRHAIAIGILATVMHQPGWAQAEANQMLIDQGRFWEARGNPERAGEAWAKLLLIDPAQPEALYGMAQLSVKNKDFTAARQYLAQLKAAPASGSYAARLEQDIALASGTGLSEIDQARKLAESASLVNDPAKLSQAIAAYDRALAGKPPQGQIAREYFTYLGYTEGGLPRAIAGLRQQVRENPNDATTQLALARHMVRGEDTRAEGLQLVEKLSRNPEVSGAAGEIWRLGLRWLGQSNMSERPLFEAYLRAFPDDEEIRKQMNSIPRGSTAARTAAASTPPRAAAPAATDTPPSAARSAGSSGTAAASPPSPRPAGARGTGTAAAASARAAVPAANAPGFDALQKGDIQTAERAFITTLQRDPTQSDALGGLGVVRMQQNDMAQAEALLERAAAQPGGSRKWSTALNSARYWNLLQASTDAQARGDRAQARRLVDQAIRLDGKNPAGRNALASLQAEAGESAAAEKTYRAVLAADSRNAQAISGLVGVLAQSGRSDEAMKLVDRLSPSDRAQVGGLPQLRASIAAGRASSAESRGDINGARNALESALRDDPSNPWIRYDLARLYLRTGATAEARGIVDGLLVSHPGSPDALYASTLLAIELNDWNRAGEMMSRIPETSRSPAMQATAREIWIQTETQRASSLARAGRTQEANRMLGDIELVAGNNPSQLNTVAQGYIDAGNAARGVSMLRRLVTGPEGQSPDTLMSYAGVLLRTDQDVEAATLLRELSRRDLTPAQRAQLDQLNVIYVTRQADALRQRGDLVGAYDTLAPALAARPNDPQVRSALARMYADSGDHQKSLDIYKQLIAAEPQDANLHVAAAMAATSLKDNRFARSSLDTALSLAPRDPDVLANAARVYRAQGDNAKAGELFASALALQNASAQTATAPAGAPRVAQAESTNPFVGLPGQRSASSAAPVRGPEIAAVQSYAVPAPVHSAAASPSAPTARRDAMAAPVRDFYPQQRAPDFIDAPNPVASPSPVPSSRQRPNDYQMASAAAPSNLARADWEPTAGVPTQSAAPVRQPTLQDELDSVRADLSPEVRAGTVVRSNSGTSGASRATVVEAPLEALIPAGNGRASLRVTPVTATAGRVGNDLNSSSQFGGGPVAALAQQSGAVGAPGSQNAKGVGLAVGYETQGFQGDIGTTPLGFRETNVVGGIRHEGEFAQDGWYNIGASRRAVTDSVASFAGVHDSRTGQSWGGVTASGVQGQIGTDRADYGVYSYGSFHGLDGHNVKSNTRSEVGAGVYWKLLSESDRLLTGGLNLGGMFYDNNQRFYTYGHGGYFSPQEFYSLSVPVRWAARQDRLNYKLEGSVGVQHFRESRANYFPTDGALQRNAAAASAGAGLSDGAVYPGQSKTGVGYSLSAAAEYQLDRNMFFGGTIGLNNASDYQQWGGGLYLRYALYPQVNPMKMPLVPFGSPYVK